MRKAASQFLNIPLSMAKSSGMARAASVAWTREHLLLALNLYCKLRFGQFHAKNPIIIDLASKMGRTPSSLAMKLCNFASLDPVHRVRNVRALTGASRQDKVMWEEFRAEISILGPESEQLLHDLYTNDQTRELDFLQRDRVRLERPPKLIVPTGPTEVRSAVRVRRGQQFFRQAILNAYGVRCCISGIDVPRLLVASHIKPWSEFPEERLNPRNGLCLSSLHDAAFDAGLITLDGACRVVLSKRLKDHFKEAAVEQNFAPYEGRSIQLPEKLAEPDPNFLEHHRSKVFAS
jgi:putative restriction endonuclease